jgi:HPt (histidine-containing phosphotransfer) domain-containing protein
MDGYLAKPMQADALYTVIAQFRPAEEASLLETCAPPMDLPAALLVAGGDRELLADLMAVLRDECPEQLATLHSAIEDSDAHQLECIAHSLKGALSAVGARPAQELAQQLETLGRLDQIEGALCIWEQLDIELTRLLAFWTRTNTTEHTPAMPF